MCQIINEISTSTSFHTNYAINEEFMLKRCPKTDEVNGQKLGFRLFLKIRSFDFSDFLHEVRGHGGS